MKKRFVIFLTALCGMTCSQNLSAQTSMGIANHLGVDVGVGTTGISVEASTPITRFVQARAGVSIMPGFKFHVNSDVSLSTPVGHQNANLNLDGSLSRTQGSLIFNVYPFRSSFFIAAGAFFGGQDVVGISGHCPEAKELYSNDNYVEVGDYKLPLNKNGDAKGALRVSGFRPYIAVGTGRPCPVGRLNFMWELGLQFQKRPYVWDAYNDGEVKLNELGNDDTFQKIMDKLTVYPVLRFTLSGRIF